MNNAQSKNPSINLVPPSAEWSLFNPSFLAGLLRHASQEWVAATESGMHFSYGYIVLPLVLHGPTRRTLPRTAARGLVAWIQENPDLVEAFPHNAQSLSRYVSEAITYGCATGMLINDAGFLRPGQGRRNVGQSTDEVLECFSKSAQVGRWIARQKTPQLTFEYLGVRP